MRAALEFSHRTWGEADAPLYGTRLPLAALILAVAALPWLGLLLAPPATREALAGENGLIELSGAVFLILAAAASMLAFWRSDGEANRFLGRRTRRNVWFALLAAFFLVCGGEELSWGQHLFGWSTPEAWKAVNAQKETNLHNLWAFQAYNEDHSAKSALELMLNFNRLFALFWLSYCVAIPLACLASSQARALVAAIGIPVPPLVIGLLFLATYAAFRLTIALPSLEPASLPTFDELKETMYEAAFALLAFVFASAERARSPTS